MLIEKKKLIILTFSRKCRENDFPKVQVRRNFRSEDRAG